MEIVDALSASPALYTLAAGLLGLLVGSFLNVVIHRLPKMLEREWREQCAELAELDAERAAAGAADVAGLHREPARAVNGPAHATPGLQTGASVDAPAPAATATLAPDLEAIRLNLERARERVATETTSEPSP